MKIANSHTTHTHLRLVIHTYIYTINYLSVYMHSFYSTTQSHSTYMVHTYVHHTPHRIRTFQVQPILKQIQYFKQLEIRTYIPLPPFLPLLCLPTQKHNVNTFHNKLPNEPLHLNSLLSGTIALVYRVSLSSMYVHTHAVI